MCHQPCPLYARCCYTVRLLPLPLHRWSPALSTPPLPTLAQVLFYVRLVGYILGRGVPKRLQITTVPTRPALP